MKLMKKTKVTSIVTKGCYFRCYFVSGRKAIASSLFEAKGKDGEDGLLLLR